MEQSFIDIIENPQHSTKKELRLNGSLPKVKPPRLVSKRNLNRRLFSTPAVALMTDPNKKLSCSYDGALNISYFEQCFQQLEKIGDGSYGEVYKVISRDDGQHYAVKVCMESYRGSFDRAERVSEVLKYERVPPSEHIVALYNAWEQDDNVYIQMELGENSLERYSELNSQLTEQQLWNVLLDMLLALKTMHDCNLIHLDVKLDNIIIFSDGSCKLSDFGLLIDVKKELRKAMEGDAKYVASELLLSKFSKAADIFSLGISMLELSCDLELPPNGPLWHDLRNGIFPEKLMKDCPKEFKNIIRRMMIKDFKKRPSAKCLLKHPRLKRMMKQRREAKSSGQILPGKLTPPFRLASTPRTPPRESLPPPVNLSNSSMSSPLAQFMPRTPPMTFSTPYSGFFDGYSRPRNESLESINESHDISSSMYFTPFSSSSEVDSVSLNSSAKKLNFVN